MASIQAKASDVIEAATKTIAAIKAKRDARDEKAIANVMAHKHGWPWNRRYLTREEAIKFLDQSDAWGWRSMYAWGDMEHAEKLLTLAQHGDPVTLNEEDARVLWG